MGSGNREAILCGDYHVAATRFKAEAKLDGTDFELEYVSDENDSGWVLTFLNSVINACIQSDGSNIDTTLAEMIDWDSAIDVFIFGTLIGAIDMRDKNMLVVTRDGEKLWFTPYDMDNVFGNNFDGSSFNDPTKTFSLQGWASEHRVMELIYTHKKDALKARFNVLTTGPLSEANVANVFTNFVAGIPVAIFDAENKAHPSTKGTSVMNIWQILNWYRMRLAHIKAEVEAL